MKGKKIFGLFSFSILMQRYMYTSRDPSWIIIASTFAPDFDIVAGEVTKKLGMNILIDGAPIRHGDSFLFAGIGFGAHIFEDARLFKHGYRYLWPGEAQRWGYRDEQVYS